MATTASAARSFVLLLSWLAVSAAQKPSGWNTLNGNPPVIIAKGGFSGLFPDSSQFAYEFAVTQSSQRYTVLYCDVQLTKDRVGICLPNISMENGTTISDVFPQEKKSYLVNGVPSWGWFSVDYTFFQLKHVYLQCSIFSRTSWFDGTLPILTVEDMLNNFNPSGTWLNIQHDSFYRKFNLSMTSYIISVSRREKVNYISSPEVSFLTSLLGRVHPRTKLVFRFLDAPSVESSMNVTYHSLLLNNLTFIKTFASGIIVPKHFIWPVSDDNYLEECSSVVRDAHDLGLEIYADDFANDLVLGYNYSYDPLAEYLSFIDNDAFSVDGVLTDHPITASEAIGCFTNLNKSNSDHGKPLIISHNGASGDYPGCTDLAYQKAVEDGADVIDCPVQLTKDGIPICMSSSNLLEACYVPGVVHLGSDETAGVKDIYSVPGFFTYNFTWHDIVTNLQPKISTPFSTSTLQRNPRYATAGNFTRLSDFLTFAKDKDLFGILITIQPVFGTPEQIQLDMLDSIIEALDDAGYSNETAQQKVLVYSYSSSVLAKFKEETDYELVYDINGAYGEVAPSGLAELQKFASAVAVPRRSVIDEDDGFTISQTEMVRSLQAAGYPVYVYNLGNEYVSLPFDFFLDATVQMNTYVEGAGVDGLITDFPATARRYKANTCRNLGNNVPRFMAPVRPGALLKSYSSKPGQKKPEARRLPPLTDDDVAEPPLPQAAGSPSTSIAMRTQTRIPVLVTLVSLVMVFSVI